MDISALLSSGLSILKDSRNQAQTSASLLSSQSLAYQAVSAENQLAAVDSSELSTQITQQGQFLFDYTSDGEECSVAIDWESSYSSTMTEGEYSTNFSFSFTLTATMTVSLAQGLSIDEESISGEDFTLTSDGILSLANDLAQQIGQTDETEVDLASELTEQMTSILEKLGLLDSEGKATAALQLMSDYAGLNRFYAGQQVTENSGLQYSASLSSRSLLWQSWIQQNLEISNEDETEAADADSSDSTGGVTINIEDNDVINIITGDYNTVTNDTSD